MPTRFVARPPATDSDPLEASGPTLRWGVVATGGIARRVTGELTQLADARLQAVSSRDAERASSFASEYGAARSYGDEGGVPGYLRLSEDPDVQVVYVATPHAHHHLVTSALLEAGKHVLVEKAFAINAPEAEHLVALARERGVFLMEAVWTRFLPVYQRALDAIESGELGLVRWVQADMGFLAPYDPRSRLWAPEHGGGALLDLSVYPFSWTVGALGLPRSVSARGVLNELGVDEINALTFEHEGGSLSQLTSTLASQAPRALTIAGTEASLRTSGSLTRPDGFWIERGEETREERFDHGPVPYAFMLREVTRCVQQGLTESPTMPLSHTLAMMHLFDDARAQMGVRYPNDERWGALSGRGPGSGTHVAARAPAEQG